MHKKTAFESLVVMYYMKILVKTILLHFISPVTAVSI